MTDLVGLLLSNFESRMRLMIVHVAIVEPFSVPELGFIFCPVVGMSHFVVVAVAEYFYYLR